MRVCVALWINIALCRTTHGTFDEDGLQMSEKGMGDGEHLYQLLDFEKVRLLGSGAQGVVHEVVHKVTGEHFAMK